MSEKRKKRIEDLEFYLTNGSLNVTHEQRMDYLISDLEFLVRGYEILVEILLREDIKPFYDPARITVIKNRYKIK